MTNHEKAQMYKMRLEGYTLQEIANQFSVSKQRVAQILPPLKQGYRALRPDMLNKIVYPNLREWMRKNTCTTRMLCDMTGTSYMSLFRGLQNAKYELRKSTIDKILEVTGMTYEEAFALDQSE